MEKNYDKQILNELKKLNKKLVGRLDNEVIDINAPLSLMECIMNINSNIAYIADVIQNKYENESDSE